LYALFFLFISFRTLFVTHGSLCLYVIILCGMFVSMDFIRSTLNIFHSSLALH